MLIRLQRNYFVAKVPYGGKVSTIRISDKNKTVFQKEFKIDSLPDITAAVGYIHDSVASVGRILSNPYLTAGCRCYYKDNVAILSFQMTVIKPGEEDFTLAAPGNRLSTDQIAVIKECKAGDQLYFFDVRAVPADGRTRKLHPFTIKIK